MATKKVTTRNHKLYKITISGTKHYVSVDKGGIFTENYYRIGETRSLEDALSLIRSHSGSDIKEIK